MRRDRPGKTVWFSLAAAGAGRRCRPMPPDAGADADAGRRRRRADTTGGARRGQPAAVPADGDRGRAAWPVPGVRAVLDGLRDAVVATDEQGQIRYVNDAAEELLGWPPRHAGRAGRPSTWCPTR